MGAPPPQNCPCAWGSGPRLMRASLGGMMKLFHGQFLRQTQQVADLKSWAWPTSGNLKRETEGVANGSTRPGVKN